MAGFAADITDWVNRAKGNINAVIRKVAFDLGARIIMRTPVDTGRARANWVLGIGAPTILDATDKIDSHKAPVNSRGLGRSIAKTELLQGLAGFDATEGKTIYITNSVPYIGRLEYGSSKQAPQGMVRLTAAEFLNITMDAVTFVRSGGSGSA